MNRNFIYGIYLAIACIGRISRSIGTGNLSFIIIIISSSSSSSNSWSTVLPCISSTLVVVLKQIVRRWCSYTTWWRWWCWWRWAAGRLGNSCWQTLLWLVGAYDVVADVIGVVLLPPALCLRSLNVTAVVYSLTSHNSCIIPMPSWRRQQETISPLSSLKFWAVEKLSKNLHVWNFSSKNAIFFKPKHPFEEI